MAVLVVKVVGVPSAPVIVYVLTVIGLPGPAGPLAEELPDAPVFVVGRVVPVFTFTVGRVPVPVAVGTPALTSTLGGLKLRGSAANGGARRRGSGGH